MPADIITHIKRLATFIASLRTRLQSLAKARPALFVVIFFAGLAIFLFAFFSVFMPLVIPAAGWITAWVNRQNAVVATLVIALFTGAALIAWSTLLHRLGMGFTFYRKHQISWFVTTLIFTGILGFGMLSPFFVRPAVFIERFPPSDPSTKLAIMTQVAFASLSVGGLVYLFKRASKFYYGISEILVGLAANLGLMAHIDLSHPPHLAITTDDVIKLTAFIYLLSRGFSNVMEGYTEQAAQASPSSDPARRANGSGDSVL
jgi:MFS family permease